MYRAGRLRQQTGRLFPARRSSAADDPRGAPRRVIDYAGVDPLRTERDENIPANLQTPGLQRTGASTRAAVSFTSLVLMAWRSMSRPSTPLPPREPPPQRSSVLRWDQPTPNRVAS